MTLYELTGQYQYLYDLLSGGEIDEETFADSLEGMEFADRLREKAEDYAKVIKSLEADARAIDDEINRLDERSNNCRKNAGRLKDALYNAMKLTGEEKFRTVMFNFAVKQNAARVVVDDIDKLQDDAELWKPRKWDEGELNKTVIKERLQAGYPVPGASLVHGESLIIR